MITIHKTELAVRSGVENVCIPGTFLSMQVQYNKLILWYIVNTELSNYNTIIIHKYMTGQEGYFENKKFIGTYQFDEGTFVLHVFKE